MDKAAIADEIRRRALAANLDPNAMTRIAQIESRLDPNAKNPNSSASGLFQFINSTGRQYGLSNPFDPIANIDAGIRLASDNRAALARTLGREPTPGELYLAHQQGIGGATKLLQNPSIPAVNAVGSQAVRLNGGNVNMTAGEFASMWDRKMGGGGPLEMTVNKAPPQQQGAIPVTSGSPAMDGTPSMPMAAAQQPMSPEAFQTAVYNSAPLTGNDALDFRIKDDAVQRGYASWDEALKANQPAKTQEQDALAKLLSGQWG